MHLTWIPSAPVNGIISGTVTDNQNYPISGALISAGSVNTTTDTRGVYTLSLAPGTYTVSCSASSYQIQFQYNVSVASNQTIQVNFNLANTSNQDDALSPSSIVLHQNYPNPFNKTTVIPYYLDKATPFKIAIFNLKGQLVRSFPGYVSEKGWHNVVWDGYNEQGQKAVSGKYLCKLTADGSTRSRWISYIQR